MSEHEVRVVAEVEARAGESEALAAHIDTLSGPTREERGNVEYVVIQDADNESHFLFCERWASRADFDKHLASAHLAKFVTDVETLLSAPIRIVTGTSR